ncbi:hypothetical protein RclHR1_03440018 [Rhizophagus clarus]|uniref:Mediator of RNA polymerase II transcription subunit 7 n=1 Tax=Rhizophagus clarus TaxID=94130 RepID=A0A2Z6RA24_9GLOM|nr:hypothetical protein RclHR1_03440018 [Rhizophagus clarus]
MTYGVFAIESFVPFYCKDPIPYVPTDPTGDPPAHLVAMDINQLINALKNDADALLVNDRMTVIPNLININHEIKHIIGLIIDHSVQIEEKARQTREELDILTGILKFMQEVINTREREIHGIRQCFIACQNERNGLQNE